MTSIPPDIQAYVQMKLDSGQFANVDEFAFAAIRAFREMEDQQAKWKAAIDEGLDDLDAGREIPWDPDSIKREIRETYAFPDEDATR